MKGNSDFWQGRIGFDRLWKYEPGCECLDEYDLVAVQCSNGIMQYRLRCYSCFRVAGGNLPYEYLSQNEMRSAPVIRTNPPKKYPPCSHCGADKVSTELHHWAPKAVFDDPDRWPTDYLCRPCHQLWHVKMQTPHAEMFAPKRIVEACFPERRGAGMDIRLIAKQLGPYFDEKQLHNYTATDGWRC